MSPEWPTSPLSNVIPVGSSRAKLIKLLLCRIAKMPENFSSSPLTITVFHKLFELNSNSCANCLSVEVKKLGEQPFKIAATNNNDVIFLVKSSKGLLLR